MSTQQATRRGSPPFPLSYLFAHSLQTLGETTAVTHSGLNSAWQSSFLTQRWGRAFCQSDRIYPAALPALQGFHNEAHISLLIFSLTLTACSLPLTGQTPPVSRMMLSSEALILVIFSLPQYYSPLMQKPTKFQMLFSHTTLSVRSSHGSNPSV